MASYGSTTNELGKAATLEDLDTLILDLKGFLFSVHMFHPLKQNMGAKRFREANLFMPNGNGDDKMDMAETSVYLAYIFSSSRQNNRIMDLALTPCPSEGWNVPLKIRVYNVDCYRDRFNANIPDIMTNMPRLRDELENMTPTERTTWNQVLEYSSKTTGYNQDPITSFDVGSYAGLPHYAEAVMLRFDGNKDGALDRDETLDGVFPVFKRELSIISKIKIDFVNKAVLLYLMQKGERPSIGDLLLWALTFDFNKSFKARRIRIYQIFAALSPPAPADPISQTPPPGIYPPPAGSLYSNSALGMITENFVRGLTPVVTAAPPAPAASRAIHFDIDSVDPTQLEGYDEKGPIIDPNSPYKEALEVLPQDI